MSLFLDTRGLSTVAVGICDRCKMKVPLAKMRDDGNSPGLRVCDKPGCWDHFDPYRLPARRTEDITLRYPRPEVQLIPEPPINIFQVIVEGTDSLSFGDAAAAEAFAFLGQASDSVTFSDSAVAIAGFSASATDSVVFSDSAAGAFDTAAYKIWLRAEDAGLPFLDSSPSARAFDSVFGVSRQTTTVYEGSGSFVFNGAIAYAAASDLDPTNRDFYVRGAYMFSDVGTLRYLFGQANSLGSDSSVSFALRRTAANELEAIIVEAGTFTVNVLTSPPQTFSTSIWDVLGLRRNVDVFEIIRNNVVVASLNLGSSFVVNTSGNSFCFGRLGAFGSDSFSGFADELIYERE